MSATAPGEPRPAAAPRWLWIAVGAGALLRLLAALASDPTPGDDAGRLAAACRWAQHPGWIGLSGVWSPLPVYLVGGLTRLWEHPMFWSRLFGWLCTTATLPVFFLAVREWDLDARRAAWATLLLALYYVHIWMAGTAYTEAPYTLALVLALWWMLRAARSEGTGRERDAWLAGLAMAAALLLRHEAKLVWAVALVWLTLNASRGVAIRFAVPSLAAIVWQLVEPSMRTGGFAQDAALVLAMKAAEVSLHGSKLHAIGRWFLMPAGSPSIVVVVLGLIGLWRSRAEWRRDLFGWLFVVQAGFYFALTLYPGWQPYLRYLFMYFVFLLPHAARLFARLGTRGRWIPATLLAVAMLNQGVAWWIGRNQGRSLGWLPVYRATADQRALDRWVLRHGDAGRVITLSAYPWAWDVASSLVQARRCDLLEQFQPVSYEQNLGLARGERLDVSSYDAVLLDPAASGADAMRRGLPEGSRSEMITPRLEVVWMRGGPPPVGGAP